MGLTEVTLLLTVLPVAVMWTALRERKGESVVLMSTGSDKSRLRNLLTFFFRLRQALHFCVFRMFISGLFMATYC